MADALNSEQRSRNMAAIKARNTRPELRVRKMLFKLGFRYRLHAKKLPGKPDLILPKYNAVIFVNGCFWHAHGCNLSPMPSSNKLFWDHKINGNKQRDERNIQALLSSGWRVLIIWECAMRGLGRLSDEKIARLSQRWLRGKNNFTNIHGI